eukprot:4781199-Lingulodinium_polyedra.AAC.1
MRVAERRRGTENTIGHAPKIFIAGTARVKNKYHSRPGCPAIARALDIGRHEECLLCKRERMQKKSKE